MKHVLLTKTAFEKYTKRGVMHVAKYIKVFGGCSRSGWDGYKYNKLLDAGQYKYRAIYKNKHYSTVVYSIFKNEMYFRFVTPYYTHDDFSRGTSIRKYMIATYHPDDTGQMIEELAYWRPNSPIEREWANEVIKKYGLTKETCQDYLFYVRREQRKPHRYRFKLLYRDIDLPRIEDAFFSRTAIREYCTGNSVDFLWMPSSTEDNYTSLWNSERVKSVVDMMKDTLIPSEIHRPTKEKYVYWFMHYGDLTKEQADECFEKRSRMGLP